MEERKKKDLYIKYDKKGYQAREYKEQDPGQKNNKRKIVDMIRLMGSTPHRTRLIFKIEIQKGDSWIPTKILLDSGAERNFITQIFINKQNLESNE